MYRQSKSRIAGFISFFISFQPQICFSYSSRSYVCMYNILCFFFHRREEKISTSLINSSILLYVYNRKHTYTHALRIDFTLECVSNVRDLCCYISSCPVPSHLDSFSIAYAKRVSVERERKRETNMSIQICVWIVSSEKIVE